MPRRALGAVLHPPAVWRTACTNDVCTLSPHAGPPQPDDAMGRFSNCAGGPFLASLESVQCLFGDRIGVQSGGVDASDAPHGLVPMQAAGAFNHPISLQPCGQVPCRAFCGVAALANSRSIGRAPRLASHPGKALVRPQKDLEQVLTHRPTCAAGCGTCPTGQSPQDQFRPRFGAA